MATKKQSFFGKIMGNSDDTETDIYDVSQDDTEEIEIDDDEEMEEEYEEDTDEAEELVDEEEDYEEEIEYELDEEGTEEEPEPVTVSNTSEEGWMSDYEGALNIDMYQTKDNVILKSTIAGVGPDDLDITVANDMITINGSRHKEEKVSADDYFYQECYWGKFSRSVIIPVDIDSENIEADTKDGVLTIIVPKAAKAKTKKIKVKRS